MARDNRSIGRFILDGIPPAPRGVPQIEVSFDMDANGILNVSAKDKGTGKEQHIRIEASTGLSKEEIEKMKAEAEINAESDKKEREKVDKLNAADTLVFQTEKQLKEFGEKLSPDKKATIEAAANKLKEAHKAQDMNMIESATSELNAAWQVASEEMYKATQNENGAGNAGSENGNASSNQGGEDVTDVEFEEVKKD